MAKQNKRTFLFSIEWYEVLSEYPEEVRFEVYEAIIRYASTGTTGELKPLSKMAFSFIKKEMDYNSRQYDDKITQRSEAGKKGGAPKGNQNARKASTEQASVELLEDESETSVVEDEQASTSKTSENNQKQANQPKQASTSKTSLIVNDNVIVNDIVLKEKNTKKESECVFSQLESQFEEFRKAYPGRKRGHDTEFGAFKRKHQNWAEIVPLLMPALERINAYNAQMQSRGQWSPQWANLSTWLFQSRWEDELPTTSASATAKQETAVQKPTVQAIDYDEELDAFKSKNR